MTDLTGIEPPENCLRCERLVRYRMLNRANNPDWHNNPVPSFGDPDAKLMIVGLAPGLQGANRTGRPFTGDHAGILLYKTLADFGYGKGHYSAHADDEFRLQGAAISNAVRCVPPENKPLPAEIANCRVFLTATIRSHTSLRIILALGRIAHESTLKALDEKPARYPFIHGAHYLLSSGITLVDCYHCSRYNTNTGRLTEEMFRSVFASISALI